MGATKRHVKAIIQLRRATEAEWIKINPILRLGEPALSTDVYKLKLGDGKTNWVDLPYLNEQEIQAVVDRLDDLTLDDLIDDFVVINCGTSTTVI